MSFPPNLISSLRCPYCGSAFEIEAEINVLPDGLDDAIIRCDCYSYPIVRGITVLRQQGPVYSTRNEAVECLRRNDPRGALSWLIQNGSAPGVGGPDQRKRNWVFRPRAADARGYKSKIFLRF